MTKKHKGCPDWLGLSEDRTSFVFIPERAQIVRKIFELSKAGIGGYTIAKQLNASQIAGLGRSGRWNPSTIHNILCNRATIGEYQKKRRVNGKLVPCGNPVPNYYPAVIEEQLFQAAQVARVENLASGRGSKGNLVANLFTAVASCFYCGNSVRFQSSAKSLLCSEVLDGKGCYRFCWSYSDFETSVLALVKQHRVPKLTKLVVELDRASGKEAYAIRIELMFALRQNLSKLSIAAAGNAPTERDGALRISRDHPGRFFEIGFVDGLQDIGYPTAPVLSPNVKIDPAQLVSALRLSPRQAAIVVSLASGRSLVQTAQHLQIRLSTARWHLKLIFNKTNTHSQADLIRLSKKYVASDFAVDPIPKE